MKTIQYKWFISITTYCDEVIPTTEDNTITFFFTIANEFESDKDVFSI